MTTMRSRSFRSWSQLSATGTDVPYGLSEREFVVLQLLTEGLYDPQIAEVLDIPEDTVRSQVVSIVGKMNTRSRTEAGVRAIREGLFSRD